jgi:Uri superfamily endonuclease
LTRADNNTPAAWRKDILSYPNTPGTYVLFVQVNEPVTLSVGRLGTVNFTVGLYAYVGSAHGPGGVRARVGRHLRADKTRHWHIDALTAAAPIIAVWYTASPARLECKWAAACATLPGVTVPVPGFGSSDCTCRAHLFQVTDAAVQPAWEALNRPTVCGTLP